MTSYFKFPALFFIAFCAMTNISHAAIALFKEKALITAAAEGKYDEVRAELLRNVDVNSSGNEGVTGLIAAAKNRHPEIVDMFLNEFHALPDITDSLGNTALFYAVNSLDFESVRLLLDANADPNRRNPQGETPLHWSAREGDMEIIQMLLDAGADTHIRDFTGRDFMESVQHSRNPNLYNDLQRLGY